MAELVPTELLGLWQLRRRLLDRRLRLHGTVVGTLTLSPDDGGVRWLERGQLCWPGRSAVVFRELRLREDAAGWQVFFADGRIFHPWRPGAAVVHHCGQDVYRGVVDTARNRLRILWDVAGPAKEQ